MAHHFKNPGINDDHIKSITFPVPAGLSYEETSQIVKEQVFGAIQNRHQAKLKHTLVMHFNLDDQCPTSTDHLRRISEDLTAKTSKIPVIHAGLLTTETLLVSA